MMKKILILTIAILFTCFAHAAQPGDIVFSEIAWSGTLGSSGYEWMELFNTTGADIDLTGWYITDSGGTIVDLSTANTKTISAGGYYVIEYKSTSEPEKEALGDIVGDSDDLGYSKLSNDGELLTLKDASGNIIDEIDCSSGWFAGVTGAISMEKKILGKSGDDPTNWASNDLVTMNGHDHLGNPIYGTPRRRNSCAPSAETINLATSVYPKKIEVAGGDPETTTVTVELLNELYAIYASSPLLDVTLTAYPSLSGHFSGGTDTVVLTLVNGTGQTDFGGCLIPGSVRFTASSAAHIDGFSSSDLEVDAVDVSGPFAVTFIPDKDVPLISIENIKLNITISETGGMYNTQAITVHYKVYDPEGNLSGESSRNISYTSGASDYEGNLIWGSSLLFSGFIDFTNGGGITVESGSMIGIWLTGTDRKGNAMSTAENSEEDFFVELTVKDTKLIVTEVDFISTLGEDFVELYCEDDGAAGLGVDISGYYIDDLDSVSSSGSLALLSDLEENADKKIDNLTVKTGDYILLIYDNGDDLKQKFSSGATLHVIYTADSGLTDSDEQIAVFDPSGKMIDLVCWADMSGSISDDDFHEAFAAGQWNIGYGSPSDEEEIDCVASGFSKGSIVRDYYNTDTNDKADWKQTYAQTPGYGHPPDELPSGVDIVISEVYFYSPSGFPDWVELYCKDDGNEGKGVEIGGCFIKADSTPIKTFKTGTTMRTGDFAVVVQGDPKNDEYRAGADGIITVFVEGDGVALSSTDENLDFRDFSGNIKDVVVWAERSATDYGFPLDENEDLLPGAYVVPDTTAYKGEMLVDISYTEYDDFIEAIYTEDPKLGIQHWAGDVYKFFPNIVKYPDFPAGTEPDYGYVYDWTYACTGAIIANQVKEESSVTRDVNYTDTNTKDDWTITDKPTMGRGADKTDAPAGKLTDIDISPRTFVNDGSVPERLYTTITLNSLSEGVLTIRVYDIAGREVKTLVEKQPVPPGPFSTQWWGNDNENCPLPIGVYIVYFELRSDGGSVAKKAVVAIGKKM